MENIKVKFLNNELDVHFTQYGIDGTTAIVLLNEDKEMFAVATVNIGLYMEQDEVSIKDYSENTGMVAALKEANVIDELMTVRNSGFVEVPIYKLSSKAVKQMKKDFAEQGI